MVMSNSINISENYLIEEVPLFQIPGIMAASDIQDYYNLCQVLIIKRKLTLAAAKKLFRSVWYLKIFLTVDLKKLKKAGKVPPESMMKQFLCIQKDLNQCFENLGFKESDFKQMQIKLPYPETIDLNFNNHSGDISMTPENQT